MKKRGIQAEWNTTNRTVKGMEKRESAKDRVARQSYNPGMALNDVLSLLDAEIERFKAARAILAAGSMVTAAPRKAGRPPKVQPASPKVPKRKKKRNLTPEGRARIAAAAKRRWTTKRRP
jgi:hypothetical protein